MKRASSFLEYVVIVGLVSALLMAMNVYAKRGIQAKIKDMTDYYISKEQVTEVNSDIKDNKSTSNSVYNSDLDTTLSLGGGTDIKGKDVVVTQTDSSAIYEDVPEGRGLTPANGPITVENK